MEDRDNAWQEIKRLIELEKQEALEDFRRRGFVVAERPRLRTEPGPGRRPVLLPAALAAAALLLAAGLVSFWLLRGNWKSSPASPAVSDLLAGSFLYSQSGPPAASGGAAAAPAAAPLFTAWAEAGMERLAPAAGTGREAGRDPGSVVEHVDPETVRRRIGRAIAEGAFEQWLQNLIEINNQEA